MDRSVFPRPPDLCPDLFNALIVGRLDLVKGHHIAIAALQESGMPTDVGLCIVGDGPRRRELESLASAKDIGGRVSVIGFRRNVYDYIAHCDVLLMPSLHEGLPYALLEAMALGVPIVASRVGGLVEVLEDGVTGILVSAGRPDELAAAVSRLRRDPSLRARVGRQAQALQRSRFSLEAMADSYLEVYREALA